MSRENALAARDDRSSGSRSSDEREGAYQWLVSVLSATEADEDQAVQAFRAQELGGRLLEVSAVSAWVRRTARREGRATRIVEVAIGDDEALSSGRQVTGTQVGMKFRTLEFPGTDNVERVPVKIGGALDSLRRLSVQLANEYGWQRAQGTGFVLSGAVPLVPTLLGTVDPGLGVFPNRRVTITADPTVSPQRVERTFRELRRKLLAGRWRHAEPHTYELGADAALRSDQPWRMRMESWNRQNPQHWIDDERQFRSTARRIWAQVGWQ